MTDGGQDFDLGQVVGSAGAKGEQGDKGDTGNGIQSIVLRSTSGRVKTYRITFTDGNTFDYQVTDGSDASVTVDSSLSSTSTNPVQNKVINSALNGKASSTHTHTISDVTNLQTNLNNKVNTSDIANNLTTTSSGKVLDARQGKALAALIGGAIQYINQ